MGAICRLHPGGMHVSTGKYPFPAGELHLPEWGPWHHEDMGVFVRNCEFSAGACDVQQHHVGKPDPVMVLVGCTKSKLTVPAPAAELYSPSALFVARRRYAEATKYPWAVLSALHGLVDPETVLEPYDFTVDDLSRPGGRVDPWAWASGVIRDAMRIVGYDNRLILEVHAGIAYVRLLRQAAESYHDWSVEILHPVEGLGIGEQKAWYAGVRPLGLEDRFMRSLKEE